MANDFSRDGQACPVDHRTREAWLHKSRTASDWPSSPTQSTKSDSQTQFIHHPESGRIRIPSHMTLSPQSSKRPNTLSTHREISSIPRALSPPDTPSLLAPSSSTTTATASHAHPQSDPTTPSPSSRPANNEHESGTSQDGRWIYPSEQQFFHAMLRKKHAANAADMRSIVPIHNAVNERAWAEILRWEANHTRASGQSDCGGPKLASFSGLSNKLTPRARWNTWILGYQPPFDRHDWIVDRCGTRIDYVIDFYEGKDEQKQGRPLNFYLDVRPKLNTLEGCKMRIWHAFGF